MKGSGFESPRRLQPRMQRFLEARTPAFCVLARMLPRVHACGSMFSLTRNRLPGS
jgi:hypothetical protein